MLAMILAGTSCACDNARVLFRVVCVQCRPSKRAPSQSGVHFEYLSSSTHETKLWCLRWQSHQSILITRVGKWSFVKIGGTQAGLSNPLKYSPLASNQIKLKEFKRSNRMASTRSTSKISTTVSWISERSSSVGFLHILTAESGWFQFFLPAK